MDSDEKAGELATRSESKKEERRLLIRRIEWGVIATLVLSVLSFAFWLGRVEERLHQLGQPLAELKTELTKHAESLKSELSAGAPGPQGPPGAPGTPIGTILSFGGSLEAIPNDWRVCDGSELQVAEYPELYAAIGTLWGGTPEVFFRVPDLSGAFLRGVDFKGTVDKERKTRGVEGRSGTSQGWATAMPRTRFVTESAGGHTHAVTDGISISGDWQSKGSDKSGGNSDSRRRETSVAGAHTHRISGGDEETRPQNYAVIFIIRVR